jgi:hypothetical protein
MSLYEQPSLWLSVVQAEPCPWTGSGHKCRRLGASEPDILRRVLHPCIRKGPVSSCSERLDVEIGGEHRRADFARIVYNVRVELESENGRRTSGSWRRAQPACGGRGLQQNVVEPTWDDAPLKLRGTRAKISERVSW